MHYTDCQDGKQGLTSDGKFINPIVNLEKKGDKVLGHQHTYDHVTRILSGSVFFRAHEGAQVVLEQTLTAPEEILVKKSWRHELEALEDGTRAACVFLLRDRDGQVTTVWDEECGMAAINPII